MKTIYCDGSCSGNPGPGGWGVYVKEDIGTFEMCGHGSHTTNNKMELTAAIEAIKTIINNESVIVYTDSQYVIKGITEWIAGWKKKGWKTTTGPVKNIELWKELDSLVQGKNINWKWVKGHNGDPGNEKADSLAIRGTSGETSLSYQEQKKLLQKNVKEADTKVSLVFEIGDIVIHKGGTKYIILNDMAYLEVDGSPAYSYASIEGKPEVWQRKKFLMEDGRFQKYTPTPEEHKIALAVLKEYINKLTSVRYKLIKCCPHNIVDKHESAVCTICEEDFGWFCPDSPDSICHYYSTNKQVKLKNGQIYQLPDDHDSRYETSDDCLFCHAPQERK